MRLRQRVWAQRKQRSSRQGAAVIELAFVLPLLAVLLVGIFEIGQALRITSILSEASRNACSSGSRPGCANADVTMDAQSALTNAGISAGSATITILVNGVAGNVAAAKGNDEITVVVSLPWSSVSLIRTNTFLSSGTVLSETTSMLKQG